MKPIQHLTTGMHYNISLPNTFKMARRPHALFIDDHRIARRLMNSKSPYFPPYVDGMDDYPADVFVFCNAEGDSNIKEEWSAYFGAARNVFMIQSHIPNVKQYADVMLSVYLFALHSANVGYTHYHILHGGDRVYGALISTATEIHGMQNVSQRAVTDTAQTRSALDDIFDCVSSARIWTANNSLSRRTPSPTLTDNKQSNTRTTGEENGIINTNTYNTHVKEHIIRSLKRVSDKLNYGAERKCGYDIGGRACGAVVGGIPSNTVEHLQHHKPISAGKLIFVREAIYIECCECVYQGGSGIYSMDAYIEHVESLKQDSERHKSYYAAIDTGYVIKPNN